MTSLLADAGFSAGVPREVLLAELAEWEREQAVRDARRQVLLAAVARDDVSDKQWGTDEVACLLRIAPVTAQRLLDHARVLVEQLPATLRALHAAELTVMHARVLVEETLHLGAEVRAETERRALPKAAGRTVGQFRQVVRRIVAALDTRDSQQKHEQAKAGRRVAFSPGPDGTGELWAQLPADDLAGIRACVDRLARSWRGLDERTADQRRADALTTLVTGSCNHTREHGTPTSAGAGGNVNTNVNVTIAWSTLTGLDEQPGEIAGHGPIPAGLARQLATAARARHRLLITDHTGQLIGTVNTRKREADSTSRGSACSPLAPAPTSNYEPTTELREFVAARDHTCRFPGCRRDARTCEIDHLIPWPDGPTAVENLHALCSRHHRLKHDAPGWTLTRTPDGTTHWRTPTGRHVVQPPEPPTDPSRPGHPDHPDDG